MSFVNFYNWICSFSGFAMPGALRLSFILLFLVWSLVHFVEIWRFWYLDIACIGFLWNWSFSGCGRKSIWGFGVVVLIGFVGILTIFTILAMILDVFYFSVSWSSFGCYLGVKGSKYGGMVWLFWFHFNWFCWKYGANNNKQTIIT